MTVTNPPKAFIALIGLICLTVASCADRERINCPRIKNQVMNRTTEPSTTTTTIDHGARCK